MCSRRTLLGVCAIGLFVSTTIAQSRNVNLLARVKPGPEGYSDVWGYVDPASGREFAFLLSQNGAYIIETTTPTSPVQRGYIPASASGWSTSTWRDARSYQNYVYIVTEGGGGMQIIDMSNPNNPSLVSTFRTSNWNDTHNIAIDTENGIAYACGTSGGMHIIDITNPTSPVRIARYTTASVHDLHIQSGFAYLCEIGSSTLRILDVRNLPNFSTVGTFSVPSCHQAWPTRDDQYVVTCSERRGGIMRVVDIRNRNSPTQVGSYRTGASTTSIHNAYVKERVVHAAYYSEGYRGVDISSPSSPVEVGFYDTHSSTSGFSGNWGCYPFQPSGVVYASDRTNGLFVLKPKATAESYGDATAGSGGRTPEIHRFGAPYLGNSNFKMQVDNAAQNSTAYLLIGTQRRNQILFGLTILVDTSPAVPSAVVSTATNSSGQGEISIPVPTAMIFDGLVLHAQFLVVDSGGPLGLSATDGKTFELFAR